MSPSFLDAFFVSGPVPATAMAGSYSVSLVLTSYIVASLASCTALVLGRRLANEENKISRRLIHGGGAFALGAGIWSMHFIGMLAYHMDMGMTYDLPLTVLSLIIAVVAGYGVLAVVHHSDLRFKTILGSALLLGAGISTMHYTGMLAMRMDADLRYRPDLFGLSVLIAISASAAALWICFRLAHRTGRYRRFMVAVASLIMGAAICGMHYTGMAAAVFIPHDTKHLMATGNVQVIAFIVAAVTGIILGITLVISLYREGSAVDGNGNRNIVFPARLLMLSVFLTFVTMAWIIGYSIYSDLVLKATIEEDSVIGEISEDFMNIDDDMMHAVRMATITGDPQWLGKYEEYVAKLSRLLDSVTQKFSDEDARNEIREIAAAQARQNVAEEEVFSLVKQGRLKEARASIETDNYIHGQYIYAGHLRSLSSLMESRSSSLLYATSQNLHDITYVVIATAIALFMAWFFCLRSVRNWKNALQMAREETMQITDNLRHEKARLQTIMDNITKGIVTIDPQGIIKSMNIGMETIFGYSEREIIGTSITSLIPDIGMVTSATGDNPPHIRLSSIVDRRREMRGRRKNGEIFPLTLHVRTIAQDGRLLCIGFINDITEQNQKEEQLHQAIERVEKANAAKSDFLANMSHELRTPLNSIIGMTRLLRESNLDKENYALADMVYSSSTNLLEIVNDILDLSKIEAGEMQLERIGFDILYIADSVMQTFEHIAQEKQITLVKDYGDGSTPLILGDPTRISRILINLIGNAVKYTEEGRITLRIVFDKTDETHITVNVRVIDTGIGVAPDKLKSIFDKFVQADSSTTRKYGGTGLGLAITKQLVELMGGTIGVESDLGKGSTFWFTVPFETTDTLSGTKRMRRQRKSSGMLPAAEARILIAEDHPLNQVLVRKLIERLGVRDYTIVANGAEAIQSYQQKLPSVILMDCHMPEKNGYDATRDIRVIEQRTGKHIPIVAMTANAMVGDKEKCLRYGMDEYISKPIDSDELKEVLSQWIRFEQKKDILPAVTADTASINLARLRSFTDGDIDMEKELIEIFIKQSDKNFEILSRMQPAAEGSPWTEAAHMFKGGAAGVGAETLRTLCDKAQHFAGSTEQQAALLDKINMEYAKVKSDLRAAGLLG